MPVNTPYKITAIKFSWLWCVCVCVCVYVCVCVSYLSMIDSLQV